MNDSYRPLDVKNRISGDTTLILTLGAFSKQRDGARRIQAELAAQGARYDVKTIEASMQRQCLVPKAARKFKVTTDSNHNLPILPNLLDQNFHAAGPDD